MWGDTRGEVRGVFEELLGKIGSFGLIVAISSAIRRRK
jgi:hypothetical protein